MKLRFTAIFISLIFCSYAQQKSASIEQKYFNGTITIQQYADNIFKLTFHSPQYLKNENITDAVVLKPASNVNSSNIHFGENEISFDHNKAALINIMLKDDQPVLQFKLADNEKIFGGGERALPLNRRGYKFNLYNNPSYGYGVGADNLNYSVPFFTSSKGYGLFFDNGSKGYVDIGKTNNNVFEAGFFSGEINVFVILGNDYKQILTSYQKLTGTQPLPPKWALGNLMSRFGYTGEQQVKDIANKMKEDNIPFNAVIFDLFWFGDSIKGGLGNLDWVNKTQWPNPTKMIAGFKKQNINTILITEPFIVQNTKHFSESLPYLAKDSAGKPFMIGYFYFGVGGLIDIFRKDAGDWIWNIHYKKQIANGVEGWWTDLGEPESHPSAIFHNAKDEGVKRMLGADEVHNIYGHYWNKNLFEKYAKDYPGKRLFHLNRSGFAGSPRYSIFPWTGDVGRNWSGLQAQLPVLLGMSMSGVPYVHSDAGGFAGGEGDNDLYVRWLQFAAFTPIFRPHGTALYEVDKTAISFPSEAALIDTPYRNYAKQAIDLRYAMMPYNYTLAYRQTKYGEPLMRPLYYEYPNDTAAANISDEYMWGDEILVAPVLRKGVTERKIYLPEGKWYRFVHDSLYNGSTWLTLPVKLQSVPLFMKAGSIVPLYQYGDSLRHDVKRVSWVYYPSEKESEYTAFSDDGVSKNSLSENNYQLYTLHVTPSKNSYHFVFNFSGKKTNLLKKNYNWVLDVRTIKTYPKNIFINGKKSSVSYSLYSDNNFNGLLLPVNFEEKTLDIEIDF